MQSKNMKRIKKLLTSFVILSSLSGCSTLSTGGGDIAIHLDLKHTDEFLHRPDRFINHPNHHQWDADVLDALNLVEKELKQKP